MILALLTLALLLSVSTAGVLLLMWTRSNTAAAALRAERAASAYADLEGRQVVAHLDNRSLRGVLLRGYPEGYTLEHPEWLQGAQPASLGGSLFLPREKVSMLQVFEPPADV